MKGKRFYISIVWLVLGLVLSSLSVAGVLDHFWSGVGGGLLSVVDGELAIGIYGPSLDEKGNSIGGITMLEYISRELDYHMFGNRKKKQHTS